MTLGNLLREYRISQRKNQREFVNNGVIVSQSYYSKLEQDLTNITVDNLMTLLHYNNIPIWEFFSRLDQSDDLNHQEMESFENIMLEAFYDNNKKKIEELKPLIQKSNLSVKSKEEEILQVDAWLESMKAPDDAPNNELRNKIKEKIFNIPNFNKAKVTLFCNFIQFYDLETDKMIAKKIIEQYINTSNTKMQIALLAIIDNILAYSVNTCEEKNVSYFIESGEKIKTKPELFFYKTVFYFFKNLIDYRLTNNRESYLKSEQMKNFLIDIGMKTYGSSLDKLLEYK